MTDAHLAVTNPTQPNQEDRMTSTTISTALSHDETIAALDYLVGTRVSATGYSFATWRFEDSLKGPNEETRAEHSEAEECWPYYSVEGLTLCARNVVGELKMEPGWGASLELLDDNLRDPEWSSVELGPLDDDARAKFDGLCVRHGVSLPGFDYDD